MSVSVRYRPSGIPEAPGAILFVGDDIDSETAAKAEREQAANDAFWESHDLELWEAKAVPKGGRR